MAKPGKQKGPRASVKRTHDQVTEERNEGSSRSDTSKGSRRKSEGKKLTTAVGAETNGSTNTTDIEKLPQSVTSRQSTTNKKSESSANHGAVILPAPVARAGTTTTTYKPTHVNGASLSGKSTTASNFQRQLLASSMPTTTSGYQPDMTRSISSSQPVLSQTNTTSLPTRTIPTNVGHGGRNSVDDTSQVTEHFSGLYHQQERDSKKEHEERLRNLKEYVRNNLFTKWKFFTSEKQMAFTDKEDGVILKICNDLHVKKESRIYWWDMNKKAILAALNRKRNDVTAYLKKHFCRKFLWN
jgi:hypothetical protein